MKTQYDVIVVGAGPAGSMTARLAAEGGASVLMLEKDREIGIPVRCAEGISEKGLHSILGQVRPEWIARRITKCKFVAPDGTLVDVALKREAGYVLNRRLFDQDLAAMAAEAGADILTRAYVYDIIRDNGRITGVRMEHLGQKQDIPAKVVIGADGVESRVGRWAGLTTRTTLAGMDSCVQMTMGDIDIDPDEIAIYFGDIVAPGGYAWMFPKGPRTGNVGLGVSGNHAKGKKPVEYLRELADKFYPDGKVLTLVAGGVPCVPTLDKIVGDGLMLVGDAAHQVNPMSGGGIGNAMIAGKIAGRIAAEGVRKDNFTAKFFNQYVREWMKAEGRNNEMSYRIQRIINEFTDTDLNTLAQTVNSIPFEKRTLFQIFKSALFKHPKLVLEAAKIFGGAA